MSVPVHALAHRPLTTEAVAELVALPAVPSVPDDFDAVDKEVRLRGWAWEEDGLVCESFRTAHGHVLCTDVVSPFGCGEARTFLVFGEVYPVDPHDEDMTNAAWLYGLVDHWQEQPGWTGSRPSTVEECEAVLAGAARVVAEHLGTAPERTVLSSDTLVTGPPLTHRVWRTATHALVLGPAADNGPYGYLTHLQLSSTPLSCGPELPPAEDEDALDAWIAAHIDW
ncbi:hypothetical protein GCM10010222_15860 [Streptomyces tanashiensis]|uniref:hypothetical protein n=1 Tax=Streptomyces tanashiensis TaxID=67367 RepID=UPI0019965BF9|nr:hypothetical protein [Streptomyces tanashiensis]GGS75615.1 hypothetical protein GCM10010222_15860 [Streptomyces tanashiensis]